MNIALICVAAPLLVGAIGLWRLVMRRKATLQDLEWLDAYSITDYRVMQRLLCEADYEFLASQPGYRPEIARKLRRERRRIFRQYLRELNADFHRIQAVARLKVAMSPQEDGEFSAF